jgi:hypothetical protein
MRVQCMHAVSSLVTVIVMGLVVIYVYAVLGWKLIVSNTETLNYGFDGEPEFGAHSTVRAFPSTP